MSVLPAYKHFQLIRGTTFDYRWQYLTGNSTSSAPIPLGPLTASLVLADPTTLTVLATWTSGVSSGHSGIFYGGDNSDPTNGIVDFVVTSADTTAITWKVANFTFTFSDSSMPPIVTMPLRGTFTVVASVL